MQNDAPAPPISELILMYQKMSNVCCFTVADACGFKKDDESCFKRNDKGFTRG